MGKIFTTIAIVGMVFGATITASFAQTVERIRVGIHADMTRIVLDVRGDADLAYDVAGTGQGKVLLIAFPKVSWNAPKVLRTPKGVVSGYQFRPHSNGGALAITTTKPIKIKRSFSLPHSGKRGARIVFDLVDQPAASGFIRAAAQRISVTQQEKPAQLAQAAPLPRETWLKNWLSAPVPGKALPHASPQGQSTFSAPLTPPQAPQVSPSYTRQPYSPTTHVPIGVKDQRMPQVPNSLALSYELPPAARLDPLQKKAQSINTNGPYMGVNFGGSFLDHKVSSATDSADIESNQTYFKIFGGYRYTRYYSLEVFYGDLGESTDTSLALEQAESGISGGGVAFQVGYPILEQLVPFAKAGVIARHADSKIGGEDQGGWSPRSYFGAGVDYWVTPHIGIRGEYENYALTNDAISAAMMYKF